MFKYAKRYRQSGKDEINTQLLEDQAEKAEQIALWEEEAAEYAIEYEANFFDIEEEMAMEEELLREEEFEMRQRELTLDDFFDSWYFTDFK